MAYNPQFLSRVRPPLGQLRTSVWEYNGTDAPAAVGAANFITNALALGMEVGDILDVNQWAVVPNVTEQSEGAVVFARNPDWPLTIKKNDATLTASARLRISDINTVIGDADYGKVTATIAVA